MWVQEEDTGVKMEQLIRSGRGTTCPIAFSFHACANTGKPLSSLKMYIYQVRNRFCYHGQSYSIFKTKNVNLLL